MKPTVRYLIPVMLVIAVAFAACGEPTSSRGSDVATGGGGSSGSRGDDGDDGATTDPAAGSTCPVDDPECAVSSPIVVDPGDDAPMKARDVQITPGLDNVNMTVFDKHRILDGDRLKLFFWGGVEDCYGVDHVDIEYGQDTVIATIFYGTKPDAEMCIEIAEYQAVTVQLQEPVGDRKIVDGGLAAT